MRLFCDFGKILTNTLIAITIGVKASQQSKQKSFEMVDFIKIFHAVLKVSNFSSFDRIFPFWTKRFLMGTFFRTKHFFFQTYNWRYTCSKNFDMFLAQIKAKKQVKFFTFCVFFRLFGSIMAKMVLRKVFMKSQILMLKQV